MSTLDYDINNEIDKSEFDRDLTPRTDNNTWRNIHFHHLALVP